MIAHGLWRGSYVVVLHIHLLSFLALWIGWVSNGQAVIALGPALLKNGGIPGHGWGMPLNVCIS